MNTYVFYLMPGTIRWAFVLFAILFVLALLLDFYRFLQMGFLWAMLYFATAAYANTLLLKKVFAPYLPEQTETEEDA